MAEETDLGPLADATPVPALGRRRMTLAEHFRRDHFPVPRIDTATWSLVVVGAVGRPLTLTLADLLAFGPAAERVVLECAGHRRTEHEPAPPGLPWGLGAVGEATWTGVRLADVLSRAEPAPSARFVLLVGADRGEVERGGVEPFTRALTIEKALHSDTLLAHEANGEPLPVARGGPVRAIVPGWYATDSVKWLTRIELREDPGDAFFEAVDYRVRLSGEDGPGQRMTDLPIHALVTDPVDGAALPPGPRVVQGAVWAGRDGVESVEVRVDGEPWGPAQLGPSRGRWARRLWTFPWDATPGPHLLEARATDLAGRAQPQAPPPNEGGFANNSVHRVACRVSR